MALDGPSSPSVGPTERAVRDALAPVTDPELDRSIVELDYVASIDVDGDLVTVELLLPTAWCSPAFAWMMAADARARVESMSGVERARIALRDHVHGEEIARGVNRGRSFASTFPDADGGVEAVRRSLEAKARLARQHVAMETLLDAGLSPEQITALRGTDLSRRGVPDGRLAIYVADRALAVVVPADPIDRYRTKARAVGLVDDATEPLFRTPGGDPIAPASFELVRRRCRSASVSMRGQASICRGLHDARRARLPAFGDD